MRTALAESLLIKVMQWSTEEVAQERPLIQAMANLKYDEYQQFSAGIRFTESLAQWLEQFDQTDRKVAYDFIKAQLIFISNDQMSHLVNICFPEKINPLLFSKTSREKKIPAYRVKDLLASSEYKEFKRKSLFLGISDGAKIDQLRRSSGISNEQVFSSYYISSEKKEDMLKELHNEGYNGKFNSVYLIDDFTASGLSYARIEKDQPTGKLIKFLKLIFNKGDHNIAESSVLSDLIDSKNLDIHVIFYIARKDAINYLSKEIENWKIQNKVNFIFKVDAIQIISEDYRSQLLANPAMLSLSKKHINQDIVDKHFEKGQYQNYFLGFDECSLPLVLSHNTPNNSLPILWWYPENEKFRGLFPRITRHRE